MAQTKQLPERPVDDVGEALGRDTGRPNPVQRIVGLAREHPE